MNGPSLEMEPSPADARPDGGCDDLDPRLLGVGLSTAETGLLDCIPVVLHESTYVKLFALGVHGAALTGRDYFDTLHCEAVCFLPGDRFEFARDMRDARGHVLAVIIPALAENGETVDLAAWRLDTGALATWLGVAVMLGEDRLTAPRIEVDALRVFPGPLEWLRAERRGVVILDPERARWRLAGERLIVDDAPFGRRIREALRLPEPRVFVETRRRAAA